MKEKLIPLKSQLFLGRNLSTIALDAFYLLQINTYSGFQGFKAPLVIEPEEYKRWKHLDKFLELRQKYLTALIFVILWNWHWQWLNIGHYLTGGKMNTGLIYSLGPGGNDKCKSKDRKHTDYCPQCWSKSLLSHLFLVCSQKRVPEERMCNKGNVWSKEKDTKKDNWGKSFVMWRKPQTLFQWATGQTAVLRLGFCFWLINNMYFQVIHHHISWGTTCNTTDSGCFLLWATVVDN